LLKSSLVWKLQHAEQVLSVKTMVDRNIRGIFFWIRVSILLTDPSNINYWEIDELD